MSSNGKKRKFHDSKSRFKSNPRRGGPAVLFTSETGREKKCEREGIDILRHYCEDPTKADDAGAKLSLDDELSMLQNSRKSKGNSDFRVFATGCRGTVFVMCDMPDCILIPSIRGAILKNQAEAEEAKESAEDEEAPSDDKEIAVVANAEKRSKVESSASTTAETTAPTTEESKDEPTQDEDSSNKEVPAKVLDTAPWDPVKTVKTIIEDLEEKKRGIPSSRFLTRMIPIQATCFASVEEIRLTTQYLLKRYFPTDAKTFAVAPKRRNCGNITSGQIIDAVATEILAVNPKCKVNLGNPDITIQVEICKTLCGICVVPDKARYRNFNLVEAREHSTPEESKEDAT